MVTPCSKSRFPPTRRRKVPGRPGGRKGERRPRNTSFAESGNAAGQRRRPRYPARQACAAVRCSIVRSRPPTTAFRDARRRGQCAPQQRLYFRPEPQGQGSLRPTLRPKVGGSSDPNPAGNPAGFPSRRDLVQAFRWRTNSGIIPAPAGRARPPPLPSTPTDRSRSRLARRSC